MKKRIILSLLCCALAFGAPAYAARIVDSSQMNLSAINAVTAKPVGSIPVGTIIAWPVANNPEGADKWLECNGQSISASVYPELVALMGAKVPDLRGLFLRGYGTQAHSQNNGSTVGVTSTNHKSGALGTVQGDAVRNTTGRLTAMVPGGGSPWSNSGAGALYNNYSATNIISSQTSGTNVRSSDKSIRYDASRVVPTANENRPVNQAVRYLIRALP